MEYLYRQPSKAWVNNEKNTFMRTERVHFGFTRILAIASQFLRHYIFDSHRR